MARWKSYFQKLLGATYMSKNIEKQQGTIIEDTKKQ